MNATPEENIPYSKALDDLKTSLLFGCSSGILLYLYFINRIDDGYILLILSYLISILLMLVPLNTLVKNPLKTFFLCAVPTLVSLILLASVGKRVDNTEAGIWFWWTIIPVLFLTLSIYLKRIRLPEDSHSSFEQHFFKLMWSNTIALILGVLTSIVAIGLVFLIIALVFGSLIDEVIYPFIFAVFASAFLFFIVFKLKSIQVIYTALFSIISVINRFCLLLFICIMPLMIGGVYYFWLKQIMGSNSIIFDDFVIFSISLIICFYTSLALYIIRLEHYTFPFFVGKILKILATLVFITLVILLLYTLMLKETATSFLSPILIWYVYGLFAVYGFMITSTLLFPKLILTNHFEGLIKLSDQVAVSSKTYNNMNALTSALMLRRLFFFIIYTSIVTPFLTSTSIFELISYSNTSEKDTVLASDLKLTEEASLLPFSDKPYDAIRTLVYLGYDPNESVNQLLFDHMQTTKKCSAEYFIDKNNLLRTICFLYPVTLKAESPHIRYFILLLLNSKDDSFYINRLYSVDVDKYEVKELTFKSITLETCKSKLRHIYPIKDRFAVSEAEREKLKNYLDGNVIFGTTPYKVITLADKRKMTVGVDKAPCSN